MQFKKEERRIIRETTKVIVKDLRALTDDYPGSKIEVAAFKKNIGDLGMCWNLEITKKHIKIANSSGSYSIVAINKKVPLVLDDYDYQVQYYLIKNYEEVRAKVEKIVNSQRDVHQDDMSLIKGVKDKYQSLLMKTKKRKSSMVEIDLPPSTNQHQIVIEKEGNKKIGTIDFGSQTIRIITKGDIVLVNQEEQKGKTKTRC